jgi:hypothetical protein
LRVRVRNTQTASRDASPTTHKPSRVTSLNG